MFVDEPPGSDAFSELRREYCDMLSTRPKFDREIERVKPEGPAVN